MQDVSDKAYAEYSSLVGVRLAWKVLWARSKIRKLSLINRQKDYLALGRNPELLPLHRTLNACLTRAAGAWPSYDYGEGYFYQSLRTVGISGLRDTEARIRAMDLASRVTGRRVLEIGCNSGFVSLSIAAAASSIVAFDINPYLIEIARLVADYSKIDNVEFSTAEFESFAPNEPFEVVLSFANHSTYDGNTKQSVQSYIERCADLLVKGGLFLFESHPPEHEGDGLAGVCELIGRSFTIEERRVLEYGTFLDRGRTFIAAVKPS